MAGLKKLQFAIGTGTAYSKKSNDSLLLNMFAQQQDPASKSDVILMNTSGYELLGQLPYDIQGIYEFLGVTYVATLTALYQFLPETSTFKAIGKVVFTDKVIFADNGISMMLVNSNGYSWTPSTGVFEDMSDQAGWFPSDTVAYMDGYFIFNRSGTGQFFITQLYSTVLDPIDWATGEAAPDDTVGVVVSNRNLFLMGEKTMEVWYDSGNPLFPFTRISGAVTDKGCADYRTIETMNQSVFWVANDFRVYMTNGYTPVQISIPSIEYELNEAKGQDLYAFSYFENSHWFYALTINNDKTYVYDKVTGLWHKRQSSEVLEGTNKWNIRGAFNSYDTGLVTGFKGDSLVRLSYETLTEEGVPMRREIVTSPINKGVDRFRIHEVQLDMEIGFDNQEAEVNLQVSKDGGVTWGSNNLSSTGKTGNNRKRVIWRRLGQTRDASFRIIIKDPIPIRLLGLFARFS